MKVIFAYSDPLLGGQLDNQDIDDFPTTDQILTDNKYYQEATKWVSEGSGVIIYNDDDISIAENIIEQYNLVHMQLVPLSEMQMVLGKYNWTYKILLKPDHNLELDGIRYEITRTEDVKSIIGERSLTDRISDRIIDFLRWLFGPLLCMIGVAMFSFTVIHCSFKKKTCKV